MRKRNHIIPLHLNKKELAHLEAKVRLRRKNGIYGLPHIIKAHIPEGHKEHISDNTGVFCR